MSGHSKWSQIKHKKAFTDQKKGIVFGRLARAISLAAKDNSDPATNLRLRKAIEQARASNMPSQNINRAIDRVAKKNASTYHELVVEALTTENVALIIQALTDNRNRTLLEIKEMLDRHSVNQVPEGSLLWMFKKTGILKIPFHELTSDQRERLELSAMEVGALDIQMNQDEMRISFPLEHLPAAREALGQITSNIISEVALIPEHHVTPSREGKEKIEALFTDLENHEDIQNVFSNITP